LFSFKVAN